MRSITLIFTALSLAYHAGAAAVPSASGSSSMVSLTSSELPSSSSLSSMSSSSMASSSMTSSGLTSSGMTSSGMSTSGMTSSSFPSSSSMSMTSSKTFVTSSSMITLPPSSVLNATGSSTISSLTNPFTNMSTVTSNSLTKSLSQAPTTVVTPNPTATPVTHGEYYLRVKALPHNNKQYDGMYLAAWQTGANVSDAVFTRNKTDALKFYLNGTLEMVDFGTSGLPWSMDMTLDSAFDQWQPVTFNLGFGNGYGAYWFNQTGLQWTPCLTPPPHTNPWQIIWDAYFGGWRVCNWWHGLPQLFYDISYLDPQHVGSCSNVMLVQEFFKH